MAESKLSSAKIDWFDDVTWELVDESAERDGTDVGEFAATCPDCGQVIMFRLFCTATAQETESDR